VRKTMSNVKHKTIKDDGHLTVITVNGKYGKYIIHVQLGEVIILPICHDKTEVYVNSEEPSIKGIKILKN
jgi:hypothetical protein